MRFQFSLATLLICMTVLAVVTAICAMKPIVVVEDKPISAVAEPIQRPPSLSETAVRMAAWGPLSMAVTLAVLWAVRRLKSRRENGPPGGVKSRSGAVV